MYLKKLEIHGFKSFADKVEIDFKKGITGIVGPNGSGKSNIIDSVRWVLGEQSPKTLRGSKMEDVIFNGTSHRKPLGMAEVSLSFDNREKILPIDYTEVTISRRIYRSGESEYLINKTPCRLKDIKELLMDTGIGIDGYSLIGQGQIDSILSNKPEERRQIFEEAAGIVKYKTRKAEAEKKLDNTHQNLIRIEDIINELESRIEPLKKQSEKAKKYLQLNNELKDLELNLFLNEINEIKLKLEAENEQFRIVKEQLNNYLHEKEMLSKKQIESHYRVESLEKEIQDLKENYFETKNIIKKLEGQCVLYNEKVQNIDNNYNRISAEIEELKNKDKSMKKLLNDLLLEKDKLSQLISKNNESLNLENQRYENLSSHLDKDEYEIENLKGEVIETLNTISSVKSEINSIKTIRENIRKRVKKIEEEKSVLFEKEEAIITDIEKLQDEINDLKNTIEERKQEKQYLFAENNKLNNKYNELVDVYKKEENILRDIQSEKKLLEEMDKSYEGFNSSVRKTLQECKKNKDIGKGIHGVVAELMNLPKGLEVAMEVALGYSMQYIVCDEQDDAKRVIKYLKQNNLGRVTFIPLDNLYVKKDSNNFLLKLNKYKGFVGKADDLISCAKKHRSLFQYLLGKTLIVDNIDTATSIAKIASRYKIVTLEGDILNPGGTITGGSYKSKVSNVFSRKRKINELSVKLEKSLNLTEKYKKCIEECKNTLNSINERLNHNSKDFDRLKLLMFKKENTLYNLLNELKSLKSSIANLDNEYLGLKSELKDMESSIEEKLSKISYLEKHNSKLQDKINMESESILNSHKELEDSKEKITSIKIKLASLKEKKEANISEINRLEASLKIWKTNQNDKINELKSLEEEKRNLLTKLNDINIKINDNTILSKQIEYNINKYNEEKIKWSDENKELNKKIEIINNTISELKDSLHKIEVKKTRLDMQCDSLIKKIWEKYELSYMDALNRKSDIEDLNKVSSRINYLKREIKDLGEVNLNSIKEFEEVNERYSFLNSQKDDLIKARDSLNKVINELESTMKKQFINSFKEINENFGYIFNQLFHGGKAKLILDTETNVLESNIEIIAQPPGKKLQNLSLLSGGERALTAIALLFSILKTKPTPFCILDEIEAALDDVNIFRFADFLKEFSKNSQFIIITHRKGTMEIIDYLYGVTMQEYGVSKIVSVKLSDVERDNMAS